MSVTIKKKPNLALLTGKQAIVLLHILAGEKKVDAARAAGVHPQAVSEMLGRTLFVEALEHLRAELFEQATNGLRHLVKDAVQLIAQTMESGAPALRFRAAAYVLDRMLGPTPLNRSVTLAHRTQVLHGHNWGSPAEALNEPATQHAVDEALRSMDKLRRANDA